MAESVIPALLEIERLTVEQRALIGLDDRAALGENVARKQRLIDSLRAGTPSPDEEDEARAILERIAAAERGNIETARTEMARLRAVLRKAQAGIVALRGYDGISGNVGATYMDKKN